MLEEAAPADVERRRGGRGAEVAGAGAIMALLPVWRRGAVRGAAVAGAGAGADADSPSGAAVSAAAGADAGASASAGSGAGAGAGAGAAASDVAGAGSADTGAPAAANDLRGDGGTVRPNLREPRALADASEDSGATKERTESPGV